MAANDAAGVLPGRKKVYGFKAPPRLSRSRLVLLGIESSIAGRRDGRRGIPDRDDPNLPASVHRRVDQANAWMNGKLARRYFRELNKLQGHKRKIEGAADGLSQTARAAGSEETSSSFVAAPATEDASTARSETTTTGRRPSVTRPDKQHVRKQSPILYLLELIGLFACEGVLNKTAFEVFAQSDTTTWILVSGLAIGLILAAHMIGKSWRRVEDKRNGTPALLVLCLVAVGAAGVLGTMRYLTVDNQRQQTISVLRQGLASVQSTNAGDVQQLEKLNKKHLSATGRTTLVTLQSRIASQKVQIRNVNSQLVAAGHTQTVDRAFVSIPLFVFLNLFLTAVASVLSYYHYDPEAAEAAAMRRHLRRRQFAAWLGNVFVSWRERRTRRRARREKRRREKEFGAASAAAARRQGESDALIRHGTALRAAGTSIDEVLNTLNNAYRAACAETEKLYEANIRRYWSANTRETTREARSLERDWRKANHRAVRKGHPVAERPDAASWKRPKSQEIPLPFQRPTELLE